MVIFNHKPGGVQLPKNPEITFFRENFQIPGGSGPPVPPSGSAHEMFTAVRMMFAVILSHRWVEV